MVLARVFVLIVVAFIQLSLSLPDCLAADLTFPLPPCQIAPITLSVRSPTASYTFLLDTGAPVTVLDHSTFRNLTTPDKLLSQTSPSAGNNGPAVRIRDVLRIGDATPISQNPLYLADLASLSAVVGFPLHGILGYDWLKNYELELASDQQQLIIRQPGTSLRGTVHPLYHDTDGRPTVRFRRFEDINPNESVEFILDTGFAGTSAVSLHTPLFQALADRNTIDVTATAITLTLTGSYRTRRGFTSIQILSSHQERIALDESAGPQAVNLIGVSYLRQFNVVMDFPNSRLYVSPRKTPGMPLDLQDCSGFGFVREQGMIVVKRVEPASPAFKADLRLDDAVVAVNGVAGEKIDLFEFRLDLCHPGKQVKLKIRRNRREHSVTLHLEDWNKPVTAEDFE